MSYPELERSDHYLEWVPRCDEHRGRPDSPSGWRRKCARHGTTPLDHYLLVSPSPSLQSGPGYPYPDLSRISLRWRGHPCNLPHPPARKTRQCTVREVQKRQLKQPQTPILFWPSNILAVAVKLRKGLSFEE